MDLNLTYMFNFILYAIHILHFTQVFSLLCIIYGYGLWCIADISNKVDIEEWARYRRKKSFLNELGGW